MNTDTTTTDTTSGPSLAGRRRAEEARRNSERMPRFAAWLATVRAFDPGARVLWARDGDETAGPVPPEARL